MTTHRQIDSTPRSSTRSMTLAAAALAALGACTTAGAGDGKTYVLVHGAWMGSAGWGPVADRLRDEGAEVRTLDLPAHGGDATAPSAATLAGYVDRVSAELDAAGTPVILVGHSMAGVVISQVADRRPDQIDSLVYLAAYVPENGKSLLDLAMTDAGSQIGPSLEFRMDGTVGIQADAFPALFCADCDDGGRAALVADYRAEPGNPLGTPVGLTLGGFGGVAKTYVHTAQDRVVSPALQATMAGGAGMRREVTLDTGHVPMLSAPDQVAAALLDE